MADVQAAKEVNKTTSHALEGRQDIMTNPSAHDRFRNMLRRKWRIYWKSPVLVILLFMAGCTFAVVNHAFYHSKDNKLVKNSYDQTNIRIGTALAVLTQLAFAGSVAEAYKQCIWNAFRRTVYTLESIDTMFEAPRSMFWVFSWAMLTTARSAFIVAAIIWTLTLTSIIPPATLTVASRVETGKASTLLPTLNFRHFTPFFRPQSLSSNLTLNETYYGQDLTPFLLQRLAMYSAVGHTILQSPLLDNLPAGWNMTTQISFHGPALKCVPADVTLERFVHERETENVYLISLSLFYAFAPIYTSDGIMEPDFSIPLAINQTPNVTSQLVVSILNIVKVCYLYNASYTVLLQKSGGVSATTIRSYKYLHPVSFTGRISDFEHHPERVSYQGILSSIGKIIVGHLYSNGLTTRSRPIYQVNQTSALNTALVNGVDVREQAKLNSLLFESSNLTSFELLEELSRNVTASLYNTAEYLLGVPAPFDVSFRRNVLIYVYKPRNLWIAYGTAIALSLVGLAIGVWSYAANGFCYDTSFSSILLSTRSYELNNEVSRMISDGIPDYKQLSKLKLKYGVLLREDETEDIGFAAPQNVQGIQRHHFRRKSM